MCFSLSLCCSCVLRWFLSSLSCSVCPPLSRGSYRPKEISIARYRRNVGSALSCSPLICGVVPNVALSPYGPCAINGLVESGAISTHPPFLPMSIFSFFHLFLRLFTLILFLYLFFPSSVACIISKLQFPSSSCLLRPSGHRYCKTNKVLENCHYVNE